MGMSYNSDGKGWDRRTKGFRQYVDRLGRVWGRARSLESAMNVIGYEAEVYVPNTSRCFGNSGTRALKSVFKIGDRGIRNKADAERAAMRWIRDHARNDRNACAQTEVADKIRHAKQAKQDKKIRACGNGRD